MAFEEGAVRIICEWLEAHAGHVIDICSGPRREHWFNAEAFVALSHKASIDTFVVYGEQNYSTVLHDNALLLQAADGKKLPDLVGFVGDDIDFIIEGKVILRTDSEAQRRTTLWKLRDQVERAKRCCISCASLGIVYLISSAGHEVEPETFYRSVEAEIDEVLEGLRWHWLRSPSGLRELRLRSTSFAYPAMHLSIGLAAFCVD